MPKLPEYNGIKKGYPRLEKYFGKLVAYIQLCRVFTLLAPLLAGVLGVLATTSLSFEHLLTAIYVGVTLALAQAAGQVINQYADVELDKIIKPYRPLPSGLLTREEALGTALLLMLISIARAFTINNFFGLLTIILIFFAVFYSLSPFSPRRVHAILNVLWMAISRGFIPIIAVWSIYGDLIRALPYALLAFIWVLGFQSTKDLEDTKGDKQFGIKTILTQYGDFGFGFLMSFATLIYIIIALFYSLHLMLFLIPIAGFTIWGAHRKSKITENTLGWLGFYAGLGIFFILMLITETLAK